MNPVRILHKYLIDRNTIPLPPEELQDCVGGKSFESIGKIFLNFFRDYCDLKPNEKILDVGCGCGRIAIPLTKFLTKRGCYAGFDTNRDAISWCNKNINKHYKNFHFKYANIYNSVYNPQGTIISKNFTFPYQDNFFDFINVSSVFTHLLPADMEQYIFEISRVLKTNGRCLMTFFLLNDESLSLMRDTTLELNFQYDFGIYMTIDENKPENAIAYKETHVFDLFSNNGLEIKKPILYGSWCSRENPVSFQDMIIAKK